MSKIEWEIVRNHASDLLTQDLVLGGFYKYCDMSKYGASFRTPFVKYEHATGNISWAKSHMDDLRGLEISEGQVDQLLVDIKTAIADHKEYIKTFKNQSVTQEKDVSLVQNWFEKSQRIIPLVAYFVFEEALAKRLKSEGFSIEDIPSAQTEVTKASEKIAALKSEPASTLQEKMLAIVHEYGYLGMKYFGGAPWTVSDVYQMVLHSNPPNPSDTSKKTHQSKTISYLAELLYLRTVKWEMMCYSTWLLREYLIKNFGTEMRYEELISHTIEEVLGILDRDYSQALKRHENYVLVVDDQGYALHDNQTKVAASKQTRHSQIKGSVAYKGKAIGIARIILSPKDAYKLQPGDILVATMSTPDFLPAMQRAAAFVTDIGGITSHAAIVSREMRKPCVIGTGNATKTLKDGDEIEVDADNGIVRIL